MPFWSRSTLSDSSSSSSSSSSSGKPSSSHNDTATSDLLKDPAAAPAKKTRDQVADEELSALLSQLDTEHKAFTKREEAAKGAEFRRQAQDTSFPTEMSCTQCFDELFFCYSIGGQLTNVYRYGTLRDCSEKGKKFRFCLKSNWMYGAAARRDSILAFHKEQAARRRMQRNSEDVWNIRKTPIDNPFADADGITDDYIQE